MNYTFNLSLINGTFPQEDLITLSNCMNYNEDILSQNLKLKLFILLLIIFILVLWFKKNGK